RPPGPTGVVGVDHVEAASPKLRQSGRLPGPRHPGDQDLSHGGTLAARGPPPFDERGDSARDRVGRNPDKEAVMPLARVVSFEGVSADRMAQMQSEMEGSERPENIPAKELIILHDPDSEKSLAI